jgi:hypothetical protein
MQEPARESGKERSWSTHRPEALHAASQFGMVPRGTDVHAAAFRINALDNPKFDEESRWALRKCEDVEVPTQGDVILTPRIPGALGPDAGRRFGKTSEPLDSTVSSFEYIVLRRVCTIDDGAHFTPKTPILTAPTVESAGAAPA